MRTLVFLASALLLTACAEPMIRDSDVIRTSMDPSFTYNEGGVVIPTSCQPGRASTYSGTPPGCARDVAFAKQVLNPSDLVDPIPPGPPPTGPVGRAADAYLNGGMDPQVVPNYGGMRGSPRTVRPQEIGGAPAPNGPNGPIYPTAPYDPYATGQ